MPLMDIEAFYLEMGELIKTERVKRGISQDILAGQLSLTRASVINLEKGRHRPSVYQLLTIAEVLGVDYAALMPGSKEKQQKPKKDILSNINKAVTDHALDKDAKNKIYEALSSFNEK